MTTPNPSPQSTPEPSTLPIQEGLSILRQIQQTRHIAEYYCRRNGIKPVPDIEAAIRDFIASKSVAASKGVCRGPT